MNRVRNFEFWLPKNTVFQIVLSTCLKVTRDPEMDSNSTWDNQATRRAGARNALLRIAEHKGDGASEQATAR